MKKVKRRVFLGGLVGLSGLVIADKIFRPEIKRVEIVEKDLSGKESSDARAKALRVNIERYLYDFFGGAEFYEDGNAYVDEMARASSTVATNVKMKGRDAVVEGYVELHRRCLDFGFSRLGKEFSVEDIDALGGNLLVHMMKSSKKVFVDYTHPAVKEAYIEFGKERANFYRGLISGNISGAQEAKSFDEMVRNLFTEEGFQRSLADYSVVRKSLYDSFSQSFDNLESRIPGFARLIRLIGPGLVDEVRKKSDGLNDRELERIYRKN
jgi:hypothetical protein